MSRFFRISVILSWVICTISAMGQSFQSAEHCRDCHSGAYAEWKVSRHSVSTAAKNPLYSAMLQWAKRTGTDELAEQCRKCHEPVSTFNLTSGKEQQITQEGVTCDVCHATKLSGKGKERWYEPTLSNAKLGPIKDAVSSEHACEYSPVHEKAEFCLTCHGAAQTPSGIGFCSTEDEWMASPFAKKKVTCQDCHMPATEGKAAPLGKVRDKIHSHAFYGGYSKTLLHNCAEVKLSVSGEGQIKKVCVQVTNQTAGHALPTGSPMRMVVLTLVAKDSLQQPVWKNWYVNPLEEDTQAVFMRLLEDKNGRAPVPPWEAARQRFDQRLLPDKPVKLEYEISEATAVAVEATLSYLLAPPSLIAKLGITEEIYSTLKTITTAIVSLK